MAEEELTSDWTRFPTLLVERALARTRDIEIDHQVDAELDKALQTIDEGFDLVDDGPFAAIAASAELDALDQWVLAVCAAVEFDRRLQRVVGTLTADVHQARVDLTLLAELLGGEAVDRLAEDARLRSAALLELADGATFAATQVVVPRRVCWSLSDDLSLDPELPLGTDLIALPPRVIGPHEVVLVHGSDRTRRLQRAMAALGRPAFLATTPPLDEGGWRVLVRQATLLGCGVVLELADGITPLTRSWVERAEHLAFGLCSTDPVELAGAPRRDYVELAAEPAEVSDAEWRGVFAGADSPVRRPTAEQLRTSANAPENVTDPAEVVRRVASGTLLKHAKRVTPRVGWDDLVLPRSQARQLRTVVERYRQRARVHDDWGLPLYPSPGVVALFSGPSGTGKTTSAEVVAKELGLEMFRVDLSALVSKYIGETEKNLEEIFSAAHTGNYLLLFDEADSLFGNRSKVEDAKDRYANMEVSYLLQRLETYDGVVILTSNFQGNIDTAFLRRIHVTVAFTLPSVSERERIWDRSLGAAPRHDLDLGHVAQEFDLSGGSIRNAALTAAFTAAASDVPVGMPEVLLAVVTEMTKLGRRVQDAQLGRWIDEVQALRS